MNDDLNIEELNDLYNFGNSLIERSKRLILELWERGEFDSKLKEDQTPVSEVDLKCEELVRSLINKSYPTHGIIGEEHGTENGEAKFVWTIDPIDGTQNLVNRIPTFGTILSLLYLGKPVLGWIDHPVLDLTISGGSGVGCYKNGKQFTLRDLETVTLTPNDLIGTNCPATFARGGHRAVLDQVLNFHPHVRMYYDVYSHSLTALGSLAAMVEYNLKIWDLAGTQAIVEGAGGKYFELGKDVVESGATCYHAVFGKPKAVDLLARYLKS